MNGSDAADARRPVQVLLDPQRFITVVEPKPPKGRRDFYAGDDLGFARHRARICARLVDIAAAMRRHGDPLGFVRVLMRDDALGKSYRPLGTLFRQEHGFAFVGTDRVGEMLFQSTPERLEALATIIMTRSETTPRVVHNARTDKLEARPTAYRAECGAIGDIDLHDAGDRVGFSARDAVRWLAQEAVIGTYVVELFRPRPELAPEAVRAAIASLTRSLYALPSGLRVRDFSAAGIDRPEGQVDGTPMVSMSIDLLEDARVKDIRHAMLGDGPPPRGQPRVERLPLFQARPARDLELEHHSALLSALSEQALVRRVELAPVIETAPAGTGIGLAPPDLIPPQPRGSYPVVGIIDGGIAGLPALEPWCAGRASLTAPEHCDPAHGTFIAGLVATGGQINAHLNPFLESGCKFYDIDVFPRRELRGRYFGGDIDYFFDLLDEAIRTAKQRHGARVFNLSFGVRTAGARFGYSPVADRLDRLARELDVILIVAAGNLELGTARPPWQNDPIATAAMLAAFGGEQQITAPGEHLLGLTVAALNPPGVSGHEAELPTTYSRRGPGVGGARKPDVAHFGGAEPSTGTAWRTGLASLTPDGGCEERCGTSFAAPCTAATLATLDHRLGGRASREMLMALTVHRATRHVALRHRTLRHVSREFVGFGLTPLAETALSDDPSAITLAFSERLMPRRRLEFDFAWPAGLVNGNGSCRGAIELTLAFTPPIDGDHQEEAMRIQLEAHLHQEGFDPDTGEAIWDSQLTQDGAGLPQGLPKTERYLLMAGLKWSPIKRYSANMPKGRGSSSNWRLSVHGLSRAGAVHPIDGVPFTILMTIGDPSGSAPVHDELRATLRNQGVRLADIAVAHRVRVL